MEQLTIRRAAAEDFDAIHAIIRGFGLSAAQTGYALGAATLIASTAGVLTSGWLNDRLQRSGHLDPRGQPKC